MHEQVSVAHRTTLHEWHTHAVRVTLDGRIISGEREEVLKSSP
jgi:hypothetical protein